jgi:STE24 endopeptidase
MKQVRPDTSGKFRSKLTDSSIDAFAKNLGYTVELCSSLIKLQIQNLSSMDADWMYSSFHYSHPILTERLRALGWSGEEKISRDEKGVDGKMVDDDKAVKATGVEKEL